MIEVTCLLLAVPIVTSLLLVFIPSRVADAKVKNLRRIVPLLLGFQALLALGLVVGIATGGDGANGGDGAKAVRQLDPGIQTVPFVGIYVDGISSLMLLMVSIVGFVVSRYSIRYLDGEAMQGRYFRWMGFTVGAVSLMVISGNLLLFFAAWTMTSFGLHQLLLHYRHREAAHRAAWTKFAISRLGDLFLVSAMMLIFQSYGTFDLAVLLEQSTKLAADSQVTGSHVAIGWLLILGALTKSAQFPFHTWLPDTMETPTPVSALMHAGIVNAGGFLVIRLSPMVALAPNALIVLAAIGGFTACFGGLVMMTQPSIKRALAYSTIAQMGFMMLQCGLGAFSSAMLHLLTHSFYKAHAFLSSGNVIAQNRFEPDKGSTNTGSKRSLVTLVSALAVSLTVFIVISLLLRINLTEKSGGGVLGFIFCLALTTWGWRMIDLRQQRFNLFAIVGLMVLCLTYLVSYWGVNHLVSPALPEITTSQAMQLVSFEVCLLFLAIFLLSTALLKGSLPEWIEPLRIHAANGFYIDALYHRVFGSITKS